MDEVEAFRHRKPEVINLDISAAHVEQLRWITLGIWVPILILGLLIGGVSIWKAGAERWHAVIAAEARV